MLKQRLGLGICKVIIICLMGSFLLDACVPRRATSAAEIPTTDVAVDVVLTEVDHQILTTVKVGQVINVKVVADAQWTVSYRAEVLESLTLPENMSQPGDTGWLFRVIAPGSTEIVLESIPPTCADGTPCPPNPMRFVFPIHAEK